MESSLGSPFFKIHPVVPSTWSSHYDLSWCCKDRVPWIVIVWAWPRIVMFWWAWLRFIMVMVRWAWHCNIMVVVRWAWLRNVMVRWAWLSNVMIWWAFRLRNVMVRWAWLRNVMIWWDCLNTHLYCVNHVILFWFHMMETYFTTHNPWYIWETKIKLKPF